MVKENIKKLLIAIGIVLILLGICVTVDYADDTISNTNVSSLDVSALKDNYTLVNGSYVLPSDAGVAKTDGKVYVDKSVKTTPTITMTGRPSCTCCARNCCSYTWRTKTYVNYCPNCHHHNCLGNKHKRGAVHEKEITCFRCDSDFCVNCGKEKYSWSSRRLTKAS